MIRQLIAVVALLLVSVSGASASDDIDTAVAAALVERADVLYGKRDFRNAKTLYIEALERDPAGEHAKAALAGLRRTNKRLGLYDRDDGRPAPPPEPNVLDPYGGESEPAAGTDPGLPGPIDPYANLGKGAAPAAGDGAVLDPYEAGEGTAAPEPDLGVADPYSGVGDVLTEPETEKDSVAGNADQGDGATGADEPDAVRITDGDATSKSSSRWARRELQGVGAGYGLFAGLTLAGPESDGAFLLGLGGMVLGGWGAGRLYDRFDLSHPQVQLINGGAAWGTITGSFFGHLISGGDTTGAEVFIPGTVGGLLGAGGGVLLVRSLPSASAGDIATVNSLGTYGLAYGLLSAAALDVFDDRAYAINALVGTAAGLGGGIWLARTTEFSRRRTLWVDAGAAAGLAVPWALLFPFIQDADDNVDVQITASVSMVTMAGGAALAYYLTRNLDTPSADEGDDSGSLALVRRTTDGRWLWRVPAPVPIGDPALAPDARSALGVGFVGGRF